MVIRDEWFYTAKVTFRFHFPKDTVVAGWAYIHSVSYKQCSSLNSCGLSTLIVSFVRHDAVIGGRCVKFIHKITYNIVNQSAISKRKTSFDINNFVS